MHVRVTVAKISMHVKIQCNKPQLYACEWNHQRKTTTKNWYSCPWMIFSAVLNPPPITVRSKRIHRYDRAHERLSHLYESNDLIELHTVTATWALQAKYMRCILLTFVCSGKYRNKLRQLVCEDVCHAHLSHKDGRIKSLWSQNLPCTGSYDQLSISLAYILLNYFLWFLL